MHVQFFKYQGAGNDFIILNNDVELSQNQIRFLCDRHFGVGSDGLMFVGPKNGNLEVRFHNPDGSMSFCGNGSRCAMAFAVDELGADGSQLIFEGFDGQHKARYDNEYAHIEMHVADSVQTIDDFNFVNTGAPHAVYKVEDVNKVDLIPEAQAARYHKRFQPVGTNVNYYSANADGTLSVRTFEKGVENETLACGTGITACALVHAGPDAAADFHFTIHAKGGTTEVVRENKVLWLGGPAKKVFVGQIELPIS